MNRDDGKAADAAEAAIREVMDQYNLTAEDVIQMIDLEDPPTSVYESGWEADKRLANEGRL